MGKDCLEKSSILIGRGGVNRKGGLAHTLFVNNVIMRQGHSMEMHLRNGRTKRRVLFYTKAEPVLYYPFRCFPLRVLKQIVIMFFSASHEGFNRAYPELVKFCLNKEYHYYPENLRIYSYYNPSGRGRMAGVSGKLYNVA
jgi:hypothetical protein